MPEPESCLTSCLNARLASRPIRPLVVLLILVVSCLSAEPARPSSNSPPASQLSPRLGDRCQTVFVADGWSTVFTTPNEIIVIGTDTVQVGERVLDHSEYVFDHTHCRVWLLAKPRAGTVVTVKCRCLRFTQPTRDQARAVIQTQLAAAADSSVVAVIDTALPEQGLGIFGSKTIGVSFGGPEGGGIDQATRVTVSGEAEGIRVEAEISDQSSPIPVEGTTRDIEELDRLLISLKARSWQGSFGDVDILVPAGPFGRIERRTKGALVSGQAGDARVTVGYAAPRGQFGRVKLSGVDGSQGPYLLAPDGRSATLVPGSETVYLNGRRMVRGWDADYTIDYSTGELVFTDRNIIDRQSRIEASFQHVVGDYQRTGTAVVADYRPTTFDFGLGLFRERDDRSRNLALDLSPEEQEYLASLGQDTSRAWLPGETYVGPGKGSYVREGDHFRYSPDSGDYAVRFTLVGDSVGDYLYDDTLFAYHYVGPGEGNYAARVRVGLPEQNEFVFARVGLNLSHFSTRVEGAFQRRNLNLFALDNPGSGSPGLSLTAAYQDSAYGLEYRHHQQGPGFDLPGGSPTVDFSYRWGGTTESERRSCDELSAYFRPWQLVDVAADVGRLARTDRGTVTRLGGSARLGWLRYEASRSGRFERHNILAAPKLGLLLPKAGWQSEAQPEERSRTWVAGLGFTADTGLERSIGCPSGELSARLTDYEKPDSVRGNWNRSSTGWLLQGSLNWSPAPALNLECRAAHQNWNYLLDDQDDWRQLLGSFRAAFAPRAGLRLMTDLSQSSRRVQLRDEFFRYVGPGRGSFRKDTIANRYVPDPTGDYERILIATGRTTAARTVSASGSGEFSVFRPAVLNGSFSLNRAGTELGELSRDAHWDSRLVIRALEPTLTPTLGTSHYSTHDRTLAATGLANSRSTAYVEISSDRISELELRSRFEFGRTQRTLNSGLLDYEELTGKAELSPVLGRRLRLELTIGLERRFVTEPVSYPELGSFVLDARRTGLARTATVGSRTRIRTSFELVHRTASVTTLPYELELSSPIGLNPAFGLELVHAFSNLLNASARYNFTDRPRRPAEHSFSAELRADF